MPFPSRSLFTHSNNFISPPIPSNPSLSLIIPSNHLNSYLFIPSYPFQSNELSSNPYLSLFPHVNPTKSIRYPSLSSDHTDPIKNPIHIAFISPPFLPFNCFHYLKFWKKIVNRKYANAYSKSVLKWILKTLPHVVLQNYANYWKIYTNLSCSK
jgi:hypothetical protein